MSSAWFWCRSVLSWVLSSMSNASFVASSIRNRGDSSVGFPYTTNMALAHDVLKSSRMMDEAPRFWGSVELLKFSLKDLLSWRAKLRKKCVFLIAARFMLIHTWSSWVGVSHLDPTNKSLMSASGFPVFEYVFTLAFSFCSNSTDCLAFFPFSGPTKNSSVKRLE